MPDDLGFLEDAVMRRIEMSRPLGQKDREFIADYIDDNYKPERDYVIGMTPDDSNITPMMVKELHDPHFSPTPVVAPKRKTLSLRFWKKD